MTGDQSLLPPRAYKPLGDYLQGRYADRVVLTFSQIEDLLGFLLPADARSARAWWDDSPSGAPSAQASAWVSACRTAIVNLSARSVVFERNLTNAPSTTGG
jgi:hypothetical protein